MVRQNLWNSEISIDLEFNKQSVSHWGQSMTVIGYSDAKYGFYYITHMLLTT